jgi:hypothetical protein
MKRQQKTIAAPRRSGVGAWRLCWLLVDLKLMELL